MSTRADRREPVRDLGAVVTFSITSSPARIGAFVKRTARAVKIVVQHGGIPRPIRWLAAVGLLPVPGPFDEAVLLLVALVLFVFYRRQLREAWERSAPEELSD